MSAEHGRPRANEPRGQSGRQKQAGQQQQQQQHQQQPHAAAPAPDVEDARALNAELKHLVERKRELWDSEIEHRRDSLRKVYLNALFGSNANSSVSKQTETLNSLWLDTSHAIIQAYRNRLAQMDKLLADSPNPPPKKANKDGPPHAQAKHNNVPGPTARRRLVHAFRAFLSADEDFFRSLLSRLAKNLLPAEVAGFPSLGIQVPDHSEHDDEAATTADEQAARRKMAIALAHKALICFGDLARYKELYAELPRQQNGKGPRKNKKDALNKRLKNWTRAAECYHQARLLVPDNGNPSNQLAVLSQYSEDNLSATYHYYRALCVKVPFPSARANLLPTYKKALAKWTSAGPPRGDEGYVFRVAFVALHAVFFTKTHLDLIPQLTKKVHDLFHIAVEERLLTSDAIVKSVVTAICALWDARMYRPSKSSATTADGKKPVNLEPHILIHLLSLYEILLSIGTIETEELFANNYPDLTLPSDAELSSNLSAVLRRALPALRIFSKFIMGQLDYVSRTEARLESRESKDASGIVSETDIVGVTRRDLVKTLKKLWTAYARFTNSLSRAFPLDRLPRALDDGVWLEEDVDMLGFTPLRRGTQNERASDSEEGRAHRIQRVGRDIHPNEEQLMRVADLEADAHLVAESESSYIAFEKDECVVEAFALASDDEWEAEEDDSPEAKEQREVKVASQRLARAFGKRAQKPREAAAIDSDNDDESDGARQGYDATEDDPVDLAMRVSAIDELDDEEDEEDEEEIVYRSLSLQQGTPSSSAAALQAPPQGQSDRQHAGDLLLNILNHGGGSGTNKAHTSPQGGSPLLGNRTLGATTSTASMPGRSIWTPPTHGGLLPPGSGRAMASFESIPNVTHQEARFGAIGGGPSQPTSAAAASPAPQGPFDFDAFNVPSPRQQASSNAPLLATATPFSPFGATGSTASGVGSRGPFSVPPGFEQRSSNKYG